MTALHRQTFYRASSFLVGSPFCKKHICHPLLNYSLADTGTLIQSVFQSQRVMNILNLILLALHAAQLIFPALVSALHFKWKKKLWSFESDDDKKNKIIKYQFWLAQSHIESPDIRFPPKSFNHNSYCRPEGCWQLLRIFKHTSQSRSGWYIVMEISKWVSGFQMGE